jgi:acetyltransferase
MIPMGLKTRGLEVFFKPRSVAVIGASAREGSIGRAVLSNLIGSPFDGAVFPVNLRQSAVLGVRAYSSVKEIPEPLDLAVLVTPADSVPALIEECAEVGVSGAVIISAGFRETGAHGMELERQVLATARRANMRLIGPNCLGVMCPSSGLNATFAPTMAKPGTMALISQSGAICTALLHWSLREQVGFSACLSIGSMLDVGWGSLIDYLGNDHHTRSILLYMESVGDARSFLSAAREVALTKPILVIKAGRTDPAAKAAASHTGALTGSDAVLDAAFRRVGVVRIDELDDVFHMTEVLAHQPRPAGPRLSIVTNAGGPGVLATDMLIGLGEQLAPLSDQTVEALNKVLPPHWSHNNPIDIIGDADPSRYEAVVRITAQDPNSDGVLVIMTPQIMSDPVEIAHKVAQFARLPGKPILASWMSGERASEGEAILNKAGIPTFVFPDTAVRAFHYLWRYSYNLNALYETPAPAESAKNAASKANELICQAHQQGRALLTELESKQLLRAYSIPTVLTRFAATADEAAKIAAEIGFPCVLKLNSFSVTHKSDVGGVKLNLASSGAVKTAFEEIERSVAERVGPQHFQGVTVQPMVQLKGYELIIGSSIDAQFGPVLVFGLGGQLVEVFKDRALALPPLNTTLARRFMEQTQVFKVLKGVRGQKPVNISRLERLLVRLSQLVVDLPMVKEIDINPLFVSPGAVMALDARIVLFPPGTELASIPKPTIRAYPSNYVETIQLRDGTTLNIRPIRPEDEPAMVRFHATLSDESVYRRFFSQLKLESRVRHERLTRVCFIDYDRGMALVAEKPKTNNEPAEIIAIGRLVKSPLKSEAEVAALVTDLFQRKGIGRELVSRLVRFAREEKLEQLVASVLTDNPSMRLLLEGQGFVFSSGLDPDVLEGEMNLV